MLIVNRAHESKSHSEVMAAFRGTEFGPSDFGQIQKPIDI